MFKLRTLGLALAGLVTAVAVAGAAFLIALDFAGTDGLAHAWSTLTGWAFHGAASVQPVFDGPVRDQPVHGQPVRDWRVG